VTSLSLCTARGSWTRRARSSPTVSSSSREPVTRPCSRRLDLDTYLRLTHALVSPTGEKSGAVDKDLAAKGLSRRVGLVAAAYLTLPLALRRSDLLAAVPSRAATRLASMAGLKMHDLPFEIPTDLPARRQIAGGAYIYMWESQEAAEAFYSGPWAEGIRAGYGCEPRISYCETVAIVDKVSGAAGALD
jgi:hypothetical protein